MGVPVCLYYFRTFSQEAVLESFYVGYLAAFQDHAVLHGRIRYPAVVANAAKRPDKRVLDHDVFTDPRQYEARTSMCPLPGVEVTAMGPHLLQVGATGVITPDRDRQLMIDAILGRAGLAVLTEEGRLQLDQWKTDAGENRSRLRVRADRVQFLGKPRQGAAHPAEHGEDANAEVAAHQGGSNDSMPF